MNIYNFHADPKLLLHHDEAHEKVPAAIWDKYKDNLAELKKREKAIAKDPKHAYLYAINVLKGPFKAGEAAIAKNPGYAYAYARFILKGSFKEGEAAIAKNPQYAHLYAERVLRGPFYLDGKLIAK